MVDLNCPNTGSRADRGLARACWISCVLGLLTMAAAARFIAGGDANGDSPLRMTMMGLLIFLLPGLFWGEALGFAISAAVGVVLLPIPFLLEARITAWIWLVSIVQLD